MAGPRPLAQRSREPLADLVRLGPLVLFLVELLEIDERVLVLGIEPQHLVEGLERAIDEPAALVVEAEAQQRVGVLELGQLRPLQQRLVDL